MTTAKPVPVVIAHPRDNDRGTRHLLADLYHMGQLIRK